jgi:hypothetical protein
MMMTFYVFRCWWLMTSANCNVGRHTSKLQEKLPDTSTNVLSTNLNHVIWYTINRALSGVSES